MRKTKAKVAKSKPATSRRRLKWGAFICHVSADKKELVTPLAIELQKFGVNVWLDDFILRVGDSLRQKIDEGLSRSKYGVVVFSPAFFDKKWPQAELDGLFAREMGGKRKIILPVRYQISLDELLEKVPLLAGRVILDAEMDVSEVARELVKEIRPKALELPQSQIDAQRASARLLEQVKQSFNNNPTLDFRMTAGNSVEPPDFDLESPDKIEVKDALASIYQPGMRIDVLTNNPEEYKKRPLEFGMELRGAGIKKFQDFVMTGRTQKLTAGEFENLKTSFGITAAFSEPNGQVFLMRQRAGKSIPVRLTFGAGPEAVVYDLMNYRVVRAGTAEAEAVIDGEGAAFSMNIHVTLNPTFNASMKFQTQLKGKSIRSVRKFVQMAKAVMNSGRMEIFNLQSGLVVSDGTLTVPSALERKMVWFGPLVDDVSEVADFFGIDVVWPQEIAKADVDLLTQLIAMIKKEVVGQSARFTCVVVKSDQNLNLFELLDTMAPWCATRGEPLMVFGTLIEGYTIAYAFDQIKVVDGEETQRKFDSAAVGDKIEIKLESVGDIRVKLWDAETNCPLDKPKPRQL